MEHYKKSKLLNDSAVSKLITRKWSEINDLSSGEYSFNKNIYIDAYSDYSDAYIVVKAGISVTGTDNANIRNKNLTFTNNAAFRSCISKTNNTFVENVDNFDILMPMYNLLEYSDNYSMTLGSFWNYYKTDETSNNKIKNNKTTTAKSS